MAFNLRNIFRRSANLVTVADNALLKDADPVRLDSTDKALTLATVYRCVTLLSQSVAQLPLLYEKNHGGVYTPAGGPLGRVIALEPNEWTNAFDFWKQAVQNVLTCGEAYIVPMYAPISGELMRLVLCTPGTAGRTTELGRYHVSDIMQGIERDFEEHEIIRLKGLSVNGQDCMSVLSYARTVMSISATADSNTLRQFANGGASMGIVSNESGVQGFGEYQGAALRSLAQSMSDAIKRGDRIISIPGKASFQNFAMTAADMQALESRKFTVLEICRFFGVHPSFVFGDTATNYKSAEMANVAFLSNTLNPILTQIEQELVRKLLPVSSFGKRRFRFDRKELYAADLMTRMSYVEKRVQTGTMTVNEARMAEGMPPVDGGDTPLVSANLRELNINTDGEDREERKDREDTEA